ncbi:MAG: hypothetical protein Q8L13_19225 [Bradyrhizobium sp.]|uniref:hypothetical protein n=1 Tax=Bradyrhizobium sp. TaxID=376 RepID=UPI00272F0038|nr:hypothetical protein [Bradyrhizobium sp.]MDP1868455.1 hypothetical protein [Bradyrhizobium sp.]
MSANFDVAMEGRIIALELFMRAILADRIIASSDRPLAAANAFKKDFLASLQHAERGPPDDRSDEVWSEAARAIRLQLDMIIQRVDSQQRRGLLPPDG